MSSRLGRYGAHKIRGPGHHHAFRQATAEDLKDIGISMRVHHLTLLEAIASFRFERPEQGS